MNDSIRSLTRILAASLLVAAPAVVLAQTGGDLARTYPTVTPRSALVMPSAAQQTAINAIHELVRDAGKPAWDWTAPAKDEALIAKVTSHAEEKLRAAYQLRNKQARTQACREAYAGVMDSLKAEGVEIGRAHV